MKDGGLAFLVLDSVYRYPFGEAWADRTFEEIAGRRYRTADAMIAAREGGGDAA
jgi:hypothetical protein